VRVIAELDRYESDTWQKHGHAADFRQICSIGLPKSSAYDLITQLPIQPNSGRRPDNSRTLLITGREG
jgi:hypothetical protein